MSFCTVILSGRCALHHPVYAHAAGEHRRGLYVLAVYDQLHPVVDLHLEKDSPKTKQRTLEEIEQSWKR